MIVFDTTSGGQSLNLGHGIFQNVMEKVMESHGILTGRKCTNPGLDLKNELGDPHFLLLNCN